MRIPEAFFKVVAHFGCNLICALAHDTYGFVNIACGFCEFNKVACYGVGVVRWISCSP